MITSLAVITPAGAILFLPIPIAANAGEAMPLAIVIGFAVVLVIMNAVYRFTQRISHAGSFFAFVRESLGIRAGFFAGWLFLAFYPVLVGLDMILFGATLNGIIVAHGGDAWMIGNFGIPGHEGLRLCASLAYVRREIPDLPYARPIEGVVAYVDLDARRVIEVLDPDPVPVPGDPGRYDPDAVGPLREDLRPIEITQPEGASFDVRGNEISWQGWRFRWSFNAREGLVLHTVGFDDHGDLRPIAHRVSLSEMVVPYGDPSPAHYWQGAFDIGDFGIGRAANSLELGCSERT